MCDEGLCRAFKMAEFPNVGGQCALKTCSQLDFLPFECEFCHETFCLEHRSPAAHACAHQPALSSCEYSGPTGTIQAYTCLLSACKNRELMPVVCPKCNQNFCLTHRHPPDHDCSSLAKAVKENVRPNSSPKTVEAPACRGRKSHRTSLQVSLMKLKMKARGLDSIPVADRVYFEIQTAVAKNSSTSSASGYFFAKDWTVGRSLDYVASQEKLINLNNVVGSQKLMLFTAAEGVLLPTDLTWSILIERSIADNGSSLKLQYVNES